MTKSYYISPVLKVKEKTEKNQEIIDLFHWFQTHVKYLQVF